MLLLNKNEQNILFDISKINDSTILLKFTESDISFINSNNSQFIEIFYHEIIVFLDNF